MVIFLKFRYNLAVSRQGHFVKSRKEYSPISDETDSYSTDIEQGGIAIEGRRPVRARRMPTGFEQLAALDSPISVNHLHKEADLESSDLHLFVQSLSKCLGGGKFGLSFDFEDLKFQPPKAVKPILSQVSGCINEGSLWGVMGASGAGKCMFGFLPCLSN